MDVLGYSERGIIGSLFHEIGHTKNPLGLLCALLSWACFPDLDVAFDLKDAKVFVDQSFSQYGTADALLLIDNCGTKQAVFIEGKVKTSQKSRWRMVDEFETFRNGVEKGSVSASNLFTQLYHKARLIKALRTGGISLLQEGVSFPEWSSRPVRRIGSNEVVIRTTSELASYCDNTLFIALVPDVAGRVAQFHKDVLRSYCSESFQEWETSNLGYLAWHQVDRFCKEHRLQRTLQVFEFNQGQIY